MITQTEWNRCVRQTRASTGGDLTMAEDCVQQAVLDLLEGGSQEPVRSYPALVQSYARKRVLRAKRLKDVEGRNLAQFAAQQATNHGDVLFVDRPRRVRGIRKVGYGKGRLLPKVPCEMCGTEIVPVMRGDGRGRQRTCSRSCGAKLRCAA